MRKIIRIIAGAILVAIGIVGLFLPILQGLLIIAGGLMVMGVKKEKIGYLFAQLRKLIKPTTIISLLLLFSFPITAEECNNCTTSIGIADYAFLKTKPILNIFSGEFWSYSSLKATESFYSLMDGISSLLNPLAIKLQFFFGDAGKAITYFSLNNIVPFVDKFLFGSWVLFAIISISFFYLMFLIVRKALVKLKIIG